MVWGCHLNQMPLNCESGTLSVHIQFCENCQSFQMHAAVFIVKFEMTLMLKSSTSYCSFWWVWTCLLDFLVLFLLWFNTVIWKTSSSLLKCISVYLRVKWIVYKIAAGLQVLLLTVEFVADLGSGFLWGILAVPCFMITNLFIVSEQYIVLNFWRVLCVWGNTVIFCTVLCCRTCA